MLQDFRRRTTPDTGAARLAALRAAMAEAGVDAFLVPRADAHQGENVAPRDERLAWLTGFTGSAGQAIVTADRAVVFVDGRYRLQVQGQVDTDRFEVRRIPEDKPADWLAEALPRGGRLGFDPWLHTAREVEELTEALGPRQVGLVRVANLVDRAWPDQPPPPARPIVAHPVALAGRDVGREARRDRPRAGGAGSGGGGADAARFHRLAPERARRGHRPHAGGARLRHPGRRRAGRALHRPRQGGRRACARTSGRRCAWRRRRPSGRRSTRSRGGWRWTRRARRPGCRTASPRTARRRWSGSATPASCRRRSRRRRRSPARGRRTCATGRRWRSSSPGST